MDRNMNLIYFEVLSYHRMAIIKGLMAANADVGIRKIYLLFTIGRNKNWCTQEVIIVEILQKVMHSAVKIP